jgi:hypothetical protein
MILMTRQTQILPDTHSNTNKNTDCDDVGVAYSGKSLSGFVPGLRNS